MIIKGIENARKGFSTMVKYLKLAAIDVIRVTRDDFFGKTFLILAPARE